MRDRRCVCAAFPIEMRQNGVIRISHYPVSLGGATAGFQGIRQRRSDLFLSFFLSEVEGRGTQRRILPLIRKKQEKQTHSGVTCSCTEKLH